MPEKDCFVDASTINCFSLGRMEPKVTLKSLVRLFGEGVTISAKTETGHELITPYQLTLLESCEVYGIDITSDTRVVVSLVAPKKDGEKNV